MFGYPAITQSDPMQELLGKVLGGYKPGQLGAAPTLGNEQGQQDYARQLAEALAQQQSAESGLGMADRLSQAQYAPNSGALGALSMMAQAYAGKKLRGRELAAQSDAMAKAYSAQEGVEDRRAMKDAERLERLTTRERTRRQSLASQMGLSNREAVEFMETGKVPQGVRKNTIVGEDGYMYNVDPYNNEAERVRVGGGERAPAGVQANYTPQPGEDPIEGKAAFEAAVAAAEGRNLPPPSGDTVDVGQVKTPQYLRGKQADKAEESYGQPQPVTGPDGKVRMVQFGNRGGSREVQGYGAPPTSRDAKPPTEAERNASGYFSRMDAAGRELDALTNSGYDPTNMRDRYTAGQGPLRNWAASEEGQNYRQQQEDWVRAKLRKESGAVIGDEEMAREISTYFPEVGDKPDVLKAKAQSRRIAEDAMRKSGGRAIEPAAEAGNDDDLIRKYL